MIRGSKIQLLFAQEAPKTKVSIPSRTANEPATQTQKIAVEIDTLFSVKSPDRKVPLGMVQRGERKEINHPYKPSNSPPAGAEAEAMQVDHVGR